jgi:hypothetical protein
MRTAIQQIRGGGKSEDRSFSRQCQYILQEF